MNYRKRERPILNIYATAGFPDMPRSRNILQALLDNPDVDAIEVGMPFSDPIADGPVIQQSNQVALDNGMSMPAYFELVQALDNSRNIPVLFMGYWNNVLRFGVERFLQHCSATGIDSTILPDLPVSVYVKQYSSLFAAHDSGINCLVAPQSTDETINLADTVSHRFIYQVSSASTTGNPGAAADQTVQYLRRIHELQLNKPRLVGFGIANHSDFMRVSQYADGAIIGSAFLRHLKTTDFGIDNIHAFIQSIRHDHSN